MSQSHLIEYRSYKAIIEKAIAQVSDEAFNLIPMADGNSIAMIMRHLAGNLKSRFTDFLTTDGEKPWRHREQEFLEGPFKRQDVVLAWEEAWAIVEDEIDALVKSDLKRDVTIRGVALTVEEALNRSIAHVAYHAGQIVLLARTYQTQNWKWISIPKGESSDYNKNPYLEKSPKGRST